MFPSVRRPLFSVVHSILFIAFCGQTHAQSSVALYGQIDAGLAYANNIDGSPAWVQTSGLVEGSYWGIRATETLGKGLNAVFRLEQGFSISNGMPVSDHPYYLGVESDRIGTLTVGNQFDLIHDYYAPFTLTETTGGSAFAPPFDNDNESGAWLAANSVKYASPMFGPFRFSAIYGFKDNGQSVPGRSHGLGFAMLNGDVNAALSWLHYSGSAPPGLRFGSGALRLPGVDAPLTSVNVDHYDTLGLGVNYTMGRVTLSAAVSRSIFAGITIEDLDAPPLSISFNNYEVNAVWEITSMFSVAGMYNYTHATNFGHWHEVAAQTQFLLSKRTSLYLQAVYIRTSLVASFAQSPSDARDNHNQWLIATGVRHSF